MIKMTIINNNQLVNKFLEKVIRQEANYQKIMKHKSKIAQTLIISNFCIFCNTVSTANIW